MHPALRLFVTQYIGAVCAALLPVIATAFLSMPLSIGGHPGESRNAQPVVARHLS